ncbi:MAG: hypothetical protein JWM14_1206 [Chitinophagaceae bacterium]|nr:hypothetical protein [Chitinophagaceae bacterium]
MKLKNIVILSFFLTALFPFASFAQSDSLGMLGDQLDLYGVLDLFKNSDNLEEFEKKLNSEDNEVNNLDLNNDDKIDYIRVVDYQDGNGHAIVLQVPINETESQDVAVIELDNTADGQAHIQIVGDEDLYGKNYIVEPLDNSQPANNSVTNNNTTVVVNVWGWRPVRYFYGPHYRAWISPWRWNAYPVWWRPWRPLGWYAYHPRLVRYHTYGRVVVVRRSPRIYTTVYAPRRVVSKVVINNRAPRPNYYNRQNNGQNYNQGRQNNTPNANQGKQNNGQNGTDGGRNYNEGRQNKTQNLDQQNKEQAKPNREQRAERKQSNSEGGKQQRVKGEGRNHQRYAGGGGRGRRGK